jgi:N-acetylgalactosamine-6-phosphate deacetylase
MQVTAEDAIHMASLHPARLLGIDNQLGSLAPGKRANIIALDGGLHLQQIWIQGRSPQPFHCVSCWPYGLRS